ncbi:Maf family protein [Candidatus Berkelbacteria bacterium]|nr:Maf family protein [Candidatus Berkelbacteria bacterium]
MHARTRDHHRPVSQAADQVVAWKNQVREKPADEDEAKAFLADYQQSPPETVTAVVVVDTATSQVRSGIDRVKVEFAELPSALVDELIADGRLMNAAGGFLAQDPRLIPYLTSMANLRASWGCRSPFSSASSRNRDLPDLTGAGVSLYSPLDKWRVGIDAMRSIRVGLALYLYEFRSIGYSPSANTGGAARAARR